MRHMSFALTTPQILARTKTVTRRLGWTFLKPGDLIQAVEKGMGLKKGEQVKRLAVLRVDNVRREPLTRLLEDTRFYGPLEVRKEGFTDLRFLSVNEFVEMFCRTHKGCTPDTEVTRIEFEYVDPQADARRAR